jgi:hypothetical protein
MTKEVSPKAAVPPATVPPAAATSTAIPVIGARVLIEGKKLAKVLSLTAKNAYDEAGAIVQRLDNGLTSRCPWSLLSAHKT